MQKYSCSERKWFGSDKKEEGGSDRSYIPTIFHHVRIILEYMAPEDGPSAKLLFQSKHLW
jgi:hypothetical protein